MHSTNTKLGIVWRSSALHSTGIGTAAVSPPLDNNWTPNWSRDELRSHQQTDPDLRQVISWLEDKTLPSQCPQGGSHALQSLWAQRQQLVLQDNLLYRRWKDLPNGGKQQTLQFVLPKQLAPVVLKELHDAHTAGHLGITKTLASARSRFYWRGQRRTSETGAISATTVTQGNHPPPTPAPKCRWLQQSTRYNALQWTFWDPFPNKSSKQVHSCGQ